MTFRFVVHDRVFDYLLCGWQIAQTDMGHHSYYSILLNWPCNCKMVEPL